MSSRQRKHFLSRVAKGLCGTCGKSLGDSPYKGSCFDCAEVSRTRLRAKRAFKPWKSGGRGRIPLYAKMKNEGTEQGA